MVHAHDYSNDLVSSRPILKWAGGKTQLLPYLIEKIPCKFNKYIEPFVGGGALFFSLKPKSGVISDSNRELINVYSSIATDSGQVIQYLRKFKYDEDEFYTIRELQFEELNPYYAAARTIYLNKTCYNGLYRVNRSGKFNVPFGRYNNPAICNPELLKAAAQILKGVSIFCGDYKDILSFTAEKNDLIYIDPPYLPISKYSDFKRYTKEQFYEEDHIEMSKEIQRLHEKGCYVLLTNSNHPLVHELYDKYDISVINTRRNVNAKSNSRIGEDVIVCIQPAKKIYVCKTPENLPNQVQLFPSTRFMGSKEKLLPFIKDVTDGIPFQSVLDLFSGTGIVSYLFKSLGKQVFSNDYMKMCSIYSKALIENNSILLTQDNIDTLFMPNDNMDCFVQNTFKDLYFTDEDNFTIDLIRTNIKRISNPYKHALAMAALIRACLKKRARGIFTYTGYRYDDGRADLKTSIEDHVRNAAQIFNDAVFNNHQSNKSRCGDALLTPHHADLIYIDPPYYSPLSDNEYVRRYHFVEGLARDWKDVDIQLHTKTKKFKNYPTPFNSRLGVSEAFNILFKRFQKSILLVSYSSNSLPSRDEITSLLVRYKEHVDVIDIDYRYSFANQKHKIHDIKNNVQEYLFIGY